MKGFIKSFLFGMLIAILTVQTSFAESVTNDSIPEDSFYRVLAEKALLNENNTNIDFKTLQGKLVMVNFIFTHCPHVCPSQVVKLKALRENLTEAQKDNVHFLSISIDPERDTPDLLKKYADNFGLTSEIWTFATGSKENIDSLKAQLFLMNPDVESPKPDDHKTAVWLLDNHGRIMQRYQGSPLNISRIKDELASLYELRFMQVQEL